MLKQFDLLRQEEVDSLCQKINEKQAHIKEFSRDKLLFEKERCLQILNRNIPMCISQHTKNILQSSDSQRILGQLHRLSLECYWKVLNIDYLEEINKQLDKKK